MNTIMAAAQVRDSIVVNVDGRASNYEILSISGNKARELRLKGRRGSQRVLIDGGDSLWIREASTRRGGHRRVAYVGLLPWITRARLDSVLTGQWQTEVEIAAAIFGVHQPTVQQLRFISMSIGQFGCGESSWRAPGPLRYRDPRQVAESDRDREGAEQLTRIRELQQILELARGIKPSGSELDGELPEQVVADVGHALRIEVGR